MNELISAFGNLDVTITENLDELIKASLIPSSITRVRLAADKSTTQ
jgi:hypothetical protein